MLQFSKLSYQVDKRLLINHVSGQIHNHEFIVITGQSSSGKSLLLKLLSGLLPFTEGEIIFNGKSLNELTPAIWRSQIAYIAQVGEMIEGNVLDNLKLPFTFNFYENQKFDLAWHQQQSIDLGKSSDFLEQDCRNLSGGEKQLVNLLRTLQLHPAIVLLDEPTASLDNTTTFQVETLIKNWYQANPNASIIWISHEPTQIQRLLDFGASHWSMAKGELTVDDYLPSTIK